MLLQLIRGVWGFVLLLAPRQLLERVGTPPGQTAAPADEVVLAMRILGARHLVEVLILSRQRSRTPPRWPVIVDGVHAASMLALAGCTRRRRRDALVSAAVATLLAAWAEVERRG